MVNIVGVLLGDSDPNKNPVTFLLLYFEVRLRVFPFCDTF